MKLLACGYITSTVTTEQGGEVKNVKNVKNGALELVPELVGDCSVLPVWGGFYVRNKSFTRAFGSATPDRSGEVLQTGDNTIVYTDGAVSWDGSSTSHATLTRCAEKKRDGVEKEGSFVQSLVSATCRRVVFVGNEGRVIELQPNIPPVEYKLEYPLPLRVTALALGAQFTLALGHCGIIWSWGINNHGQLGQGHIETVKEPTPIDYLGGLQIRDITAGYWHCIAVTEFDVVYAWGWNNKGQLALATERSMESEPVALFDEDTEITRVSCGRSHSAFIDSGDKLYVCGYNKYGQCNPGTICDELWMNNTLSDHTLLATQVSDVKCGPWSTYYLTE